jgi:ribosomal protein S18 acetylase RimI-like enzyme
MRIVRGGPSDIDRLEPLWLAMVAHHLECAPAAASVREFRAPEETWRRRRARYEAWIEERDATLLLALDDGGDAVGYAFVRVVGGEATLQTADRVGELQSLAVLPAARGAGAGTALIDATFEHLRGLGIREISLAVLDGNDAARRLYERFGLRSYYTGMLGAVPERSG